MHNHWNCTVCVSELLVAYVFCSYRSSRNAHTLPRSYSSCWHGQVLPILYTFSLSKGLRGKQSTGCPVSPLFSFCRLLQITDWLVRKKRWVGKSMTWLLGYSCFWEHHCFLSGFEASSRYNMLTLSWLWVSRNSWVSHDPVCSEHHEWCTQMVAAREQGQGHT